MDLDTSLDFTKPDLEQSDALRTQETAHDYADVIFESLQRKLIANDDPALWQAVLRAVVFDIETAVLQRKVKDQVFLQIGSCSHWFRPHKTRWTEAGGFAWPSGWHGISGHSITGLPELDWNLLLEREYSHWKPAEKFTGKSRTVIRVSVPARTTRHLQAAIHTLWSPANKRVFYGFRQLPTGWKLAARSDFYGEDEMV